MATVVYRDRIFMNGLYNGDRTHSHRAAIPAWNRVKVNSVGGQQEWVLDTIKGKNPGVSYMDAVPYNDTWCWSYHTIYNTIQCYTIQCYTIQCYTIQCYAIQCYTIQSIPYSAIPYSAIPYSAIPYSAIPYSAMPYSAIPYNLYHTVLYHTVLYNTVLYNTVLYNSPIIVPYHSATILGHTTIPYNTTLHTIPYRTVHYHTITWRVIDKIIHMALPKRGAASVLQIHVKSPIIPTCASYKYLNGEFILFRNIQSHSND